MEVCIAHGGDLTNPSGGTNRITAIAEYLSNAGVDVTLVTSRSAGAFPVEQDDIEFVEIPLRDKGVRNQPQRAALVSWYARRIVSKRDATLQLEHATLAGAATYLGCSDFVLDMHDLSYASPLYGDLPLGNYINKFIKTAEGRAVNRASKIITVSDRMRELIREEWNVPDRKIAVVPNGYQPKIKQYRRSPEKRVKGRVTFLGSLHPKLDTATIKRIASLSVVSEMIVVGDGPARKTLENATGFPKLAVKGRLDDKKAYEYTASAQIAINPQHQSVLQEASSPVKLYEYAALGLPIVATAGPSFVQQVDQNNAGTAIEPGESRQFTEVVEELLKDDSKRRPMSENAVRLAVDRDWPTRAERLVDVAYSVK